MRTNFKEREDWRFFNIDANTGQITTAEVFDRETIDYYQIIVAAEELNVEQSNPGKGVTFELSASLLEIFRCYWKGSI